MKYLHLNIYTITFFFINLLCNSQVIWTETFSNGCASGCLANTYGGWTQTNTGTNGAAANNWYISGAECGNSAGSCGSSCGSTDPSMHVGAALPGSQCAACLICPSGDCGAAYDATSFCFCNVSNVTTNKRMESPVINCTGHTNIRVRFNFIHFGQPGGDEASFWYYNGSAWTQLGIFPQTNTAACSGQGLWTPFDIALPASANNNANVRIGFNWKNNADGTGSDPSFAVDDIEVYAKQPQCFEQAMVIYTTAGCPSNCNLTEFSGSGPFCNGTSTTGCGSCPATGPTLSINYSIPAGCAASVQASFERRCNGLGCSACTFSCNQWNSSSGCCNSGLDNNDYVSIGGSGPNTGIGGVNMSPHYVAACSSNPSATITINTHTVTATGNNNGGARLFYSQVGGNVFVEGRANRMDEIITYSVTVASTCNCSDIVLPLDIMGFWAEYSKGKKNLSWFVKNEQNIKEYRLYVSKNGRHYEPIGTVPFSEFQPENKGKLYTFTDETPFFGILYYKLEVINHENTIIHSILRDLHLKNWLAPIHYSFDDNENLMLTPHDDDFPFSVQLTDLSGKIIFREEFYSTEQRIFIPKEKWGYSRLGLLSIISKHGLQIIKILLP